MFEKHNIKKKIKALTSQIQDIEKKRSRSQANLVDAILTSTETNEEDIEYFNRYTAQIVELRMQIREQQKKLNEINGVTNEEI